MRLQIRLSVLYPLVAIHDLTASATSLESAEVDARAYGGYYSSNITCEMGISLATQHNCHSIIYLLEQASRG